MVALTQVERLARMEVEVTELKEAFNEHKKDTNERFDRIESKLDSLLALRDKGAGAFWLVSIIVGSGLVSLVIEGIRWFSSSR